MLWALENVYEIRYYEVGLETPTPLAEITVCPHDPVKRPPRSTQRPSSAREDHLQSAGHTLRRLSTTEGRMPPTPL